MVARYDNAAVAILLCVSFFLSDLRFTPSLSFEATGERVPFSMGRTCVVMEIPTVALLPRNDVVVEYLPSLRGGHRPTWQSHTTTLFAGI